MSRATRNSRAGGTLIEALVALVVLSVGTAAISELLRSVSQSNRQMDFQNASLDAFTEFSAQVALAECDYMAIDPTNAPPPAGQLDPGLAAAAAGWTGMGADVYTAAAPPAGTTITLTGPIGPAGPAGVAKRNFNLHVRYRAAFVPPPVVFGSGNTAPSYDLDVEIREITGDPARDGFGVTAGPWIRTFPLKKVCNLRLDGGVGRANY